jgi:hypothetical protein
MSKTNSTHDELAVKLYLSGVTARNVVSVMNIDSGTVQRALQCRGVTTRQPGRTSTLSKVEILLVLEQSRKGVSASDLAKQFNCSMQTIYGIRHRNKPKGIQ